MRDRDAFGRPRNARPRDGQGRPLPRGATGVERVPDDIQVTPESALHLAEEHLLAGRPFHAHEVLEAMWKGTRDGERELWRGLAQLAVGLTHVQRGNAKGAIALLRRAALRLEPYGKSRPHGVAVPRLVTRANELADRIVAGGTGSVHDEELRGRLR